MSLLLLLCAAPNHAQSLQQVRQDPTFAACSQRPCLQFQPAKQQLFIAAHQPLAITQIVARSIARMYAKELALVTQHVFRNSQDPTFDSLRAWRAGAVPRLARAHRDRRADIWVGNEMKFGVTETIAFECKGTFGMMDKTKMDDVRVSFCPVHLLCAASSERPVHCRC